MNINNLYFNIYYCNDFQTIASEEYPKKITKILRQHKLIFITGGRGKAVFEGKKYYLGEGSLIYLSPGLAYDIELDTQEPISFISVLFQYVRINLNDGEYRVADADEILPLLPVQNISDYYPVEEIFKDLIHTWNAKLPGYDFISKTLLQELLIAIYQNRKKQNRNYANYQKMDKVIQYMRQNINQKITLNELAQLVQMSTFYLSKSFKEFTGYSVIEYFNKIKIDEAKIMLIEGNRKVKEVAHTLGFGDEFYFSRMFKRMEGMSPSEYYNKNIHGI